MINKRFFKTKDEVEVTFELEAQEANSVSIVADFPGPIAIGLMGMPSAARGISMPAM